MSIHPRCDQGSLTFRRWSSASAGPATQAAGPKPSNPKSSSRKPAAQGGKPARAGAQPRRATAQGKQEQQQQQKGRSGGSRWQARGPPAGRGSPPRDQRDTRQELRSHLLRDKLTVSMPDPVNPDKMLRTDVLAADIPGYEEQFMNTDMIRLMGHSISEEDVSRFITGRMSLAEQAKFEARLRFALIRPADGADRLRRREAKMSMNPDYRLDLALAPPKRSEELNAPLPSAMDVLQQQREFFKEELGVSDAEYEAICKDVAQEFETKTLPALRAPALGTGMGEVAAAAEGRLPSDHQHAATVSEKLAILEKNAYWPKATKLNIAQRLLKVLG